MEKIQFHCARCVISLCTGWKLWRMSTWNSEYMSTENLFLFSLPYILVYIIYTYICKYIYIYIYIIYLTKATISDHYHVFHRSIQSSDGCNFSSFLRQQKYLYQKKNKTICKAKRHFQSKIQTYLLNKRYNRSYHFRI